jgi:signal transduction histidine kinase
MSFWALSALINGLSSSVLGIFVYLKNRKGTVNKTYGLTTIFIGIWSYSYFFWQIAISESSALFWCRALMVGAIFIPPAYLHFVLALLGLHKEKKRIVISSYIFGSFFFFLNFTSLFVKDVSPKLFFNYWPSAGVTFLPFLFLFFICVIYAIAVMIKVQKQSSGIRQAQIRYVSLGAFLGFGGGATNYPLWYDIPIPPIGNILVSVGITVMAYAIIKYRLMDIDLARRYIAIYLSYGLISLAIFAPLIFLLRYSLLGLMMIGFIMILSAPYIHRWMQKFLQPTFLGEIYQRWEKLKGFWEKDRIVFTSSQLAEHLKEIPQLLNLESFSFFVLDRDRDVFVPESYIGLDGIFSPDPEQAKVLNTIYPDDALTRFLEKEKRIAIRDELNPIKDKDVIRQMEAISAQVSEPLFVVDRLTAILNLGPKKNGEMFHQEDIQLIREVVKIAEEHLAHISFFDSSLLFSGSVAHDIRKPFRQGIIYNYLEGIQKGSLNPIQKEALDNLKGRLKTLHQMSERIVDAFESLETFLKRGFKSQRVDYIQDVIKEIEPFKMLTKEKGLLLELSLPKQPVFVSAEPVSVRRVLNELLTNALKYTDRGKITIKVYQKSPQEVITEITDTGCGIPEEKLDDIWELFKRENRQKEGTGIGLAMVRQLIEVNGGRIWVESEVGKGSSFFFILPAWQERRK